MMEGRAGCRNGSSQQRSAPAWCRCAPAAAWRRTWREAGALVREAAGQGAVYVQTPEITTLMEMDRERLFATIRPEEANPAVRPLRRAGARARHLAAYRLDGRSCSAAARSPTARCCSRRLAPSQARFDKIHMFDVELPGGETYRESQELPGRQRRRAGRSAVGHAGADGLLRPALPPPLPRARQGRRRFPRHPLGLHPQDRRGALARAAARPRHRERQLRLRRRAGRHATRAAARPTATA